MLINQVGWSDLRDYGLALLGVVVLALLTESLQLLTVTRSFTLSDIFNDILGAICGLVFFFTYDAHLSGSWVQWQQYPRSTFLRVCVMFVLGIMLLPVFEWSYANWERASRFPSLVEFSSDWEMKFVKTTDSELQVVVAPEGWKHSTEDLVGRVKFHSNKYSGFRLEEPYPDWQGYIYLQFDIYSELSNSQPISIRIDDTYRAQPSAKRFNRRIMISPGLNHIQIPLEDIRQAPVSREMDLSSIRRVVLFAVRPPEKFTLYFDNIRLE